MTKEDLQVENGNFTRIINPLIDQLLKIPFKGCELAVAFYIIRKTYGFNKTQDEISLTQFQNGLGRSRQTVVTALKNLQLVNVARLVQRGSTKKDANIWAINKYCDTWKVVKQVRLVQRKRGTSLTEDISLVKTARHTKDYTQKTITKDNSKTSVLQGKDWNILIDSFKCINPMYEDFYKNTTERKALEDMASRWGIEKLQATILELPKIISQPYAPKITKPTELRRDIGKLIAFHNQEQNKLLDDTKNVKIII